jgi:hypothetical protein
VSGARYEIQVEGRLTQSWSGWFEGLEMSYQPGRDGEIDTTVLTVSASDPAHLHGILAQIGAFNLTLIKVQRKDY